MSSVSEENKQLRSKLVTVTKEKQVLEKKLQQHHSKLVNNFYVTFKLNFKETLTN